MKAFNLLSKSIHWRPILLLAALAGVWGCADGKNPVSDVEQRTENRAGADTVAASGKFIFNSGARTSGGRVSIIRPGAPRLINPADGLVIRAVSGIPSRVFTWDPATAGPTPDYYLLSLRDAANPSSYTANPVIIPYRSGRISTQQILPPPLAGKLIRWSVSGCQGSSNAAFRLCGPAASRTLSWLTSPRAPTLINPRANGTATPTGDQFTWSSSRGTSYYLFCAAKPGYTCPEQPVANSNTVVIRRNGYSNTVASPNLSAFLNQNINWTAAACNSAGECNYQQPRPVRVERNRPQLLSPASGETLPSKPTFNWTAVDWADYYYFCAAKPGYACPSNEVAEGSNPNVVVVKTYNTEVRPRSGFELFSGPTTVDLFQFKDQWINWTVGACKAAFPGGPPTYCEYQQQVRSALIVPHWNVVVRLADIDVRNDCDNLSKGDWRLKFALGRNSAEDVFSTSGNVKQLDWPTSNYPASRDVDSGERVSINRTLSLSNVRENDTVSLAVAAVDCDADGIWTLANVFDGVEGIVNVVRNWTQTCGGEEFWEKSGSNDVVGVAGTTLLPADWQNKRNFVLPIGSPGGQGCGLNPYSARYVINSVRF